MARSLLCFRLGTLLAMPRRSPPGCQLPFQARTASQTPTLYPPSHPPMKTPPRTALPHCWAFSYQPNPTQPNPNPRRAAYWRRFMETSSPTTCGTTGIRDDGQTSRRDVGGWESRCSNSYGYELWKDVDGTMGELLPTTCGTTGIRGNSGWDDGETSRWVVDDGGGRCGQCGRCGRCGTWTQKSPLKRA